jgi:hypothetical protein
MSITKFNSFSSACDDSASVVVLDACVHMCCCCFIYYYYYYYYLFIYLFFAVFCCIYLFIYLMFFFRGGCCFCCCCFSLCFCFAGGWRGQNMTSVVKVWTPLLHIITDLYFSVSQIVMFICYKTWGEKKHYLYCIHMPYI